MTYSKKLKKVMQQIHKILIKNDVAGVVALHTPGYSEFIIRINPSYSCAILQENSIRFKAKAEDFGGDTKARNKAINDTSNMMALLGETIGKNALIIRQVSKQFDEHVGAEHTDTTTPGK